MATAEPPTTFELLPPELRKKIYEDSECLDIRQCNRCKLCLRADVYSWGEITDATPHNLPAHATPLVLSIFRRSNNHKSLCHRFRAIRTFECSAHSASTGAVGIAQPNLTLVNKSIRAETLGMFYGRHTLYFAFHDIEVDHKIIARWLRKIGLDNSSRLRRVIIVYSVKKHARHIKKFLMPEMAKLGLKTSEVVQLERTKYPHCCCNTCASDTAISAEKRRCA
ncbi:hypothetical protein LTR53_015985 [Teratosphaeriaceae sp. CCFEE 6253]|nr:hypothetical protein LTR53_015985 [Teratosphaeriaceae sp. CCFEE 6253]